MRKYMIEKLGGLSNDTVDAITTRLSTRIDRLTAALAGESNRAVAAERDVERLTAELRDVELEHDVVKGDGARLERQFDELRKIADGAVDKLNAELNAHKRAAIGLAKVVDAVFRDERLRDVLSADMLERSGDTVSERPGYELTTADAVALTAVNALGALGQAVVDRDARIVELEAVLNEVGVDVSSIDTITVPVEDVEAARAALHAAGWSTTTADRPAE